MAFDNFWNELKQQPEELVEMVTPVIRTPNNTISLLKQTIDNIEGMTDEDLFSFTSKSYTTIIQRAFMDNNELYISAFKNTRFLTAFISAVEKGGLDSVEVMRCNTICYHYITLPTDMKDKKISNLMLRLSGVINRQFLPGLLGLGLSNDLATIILIARHSDSDLNITHKRVNHIIITQPLELMTEEMIEMIFRKIYPDIINSMYHMMLYFMKDTIPEYDENDNRTWWVTEEISEVNAVLNLAFLNILESLPYESITHAIINYCQSIQMTNPNTPVRFSLRTLSSDYYRISTVVENLIADNEIYII